MAEVGEPMSNAEKVALKFHEAYERLAPKFGYKTREASAVPWSDVPSQNKALMVAVAGEVLVSQDDGLAAALKALTESRARYGDLEARAAELEAVIERVLKMAAGDDAGAWDSHQELIRQVLLAAPSVVV